MKKRFWLLLLLALVMFAGTKSEAKQIKEYIGKWFVTSYSASDNTPRGTHATSSGAYAAAGWTCAVDMHNPLVPMGSVVEIEGFGQRKVQDVGNFGWANNGRRAFDIFIDDGDEGFLLEKKVWLIRNETKEEKKVRIKKEKKRQRKERRKKQKQRFELIYDPSLMPWEIVTDKGIIPSGICLAYWPRELMYQYRWLEVASTEDGLGNIIKIGDKHKAILEGFVYFEDVIEGEKEKLFM